MRITFSTKPLYDSDKVDQLLYHYRELYNQLLKIESIEKGEISKDSIDETYPNTLHVFLRVAKEDGLKTTKRGRALCNQLESKIKELFPEYIPHD